MNGLEIVVLAVLAVFAFAGYCTGFLRVVYSLVSWVLVLTFGTWAAPHITAFLEQNTGMKTVIQDMCVNYIQKLAEDKADPTLSLFGGLLEGTGIYEGIAAEAAHFIIEGIAFFLAMVLIGILMRWGLHALDLASHLPGVETTNKLLGAAVGALKGLVVVWLMFYLITLCGATETGRQLLAYIEESPWLSILYEHNILFRIIFKFLW